MRRVEPADGDRDGARRGTAVVRRRRARCRTRLARGEVRSAQAGARVAGARTAPGGAAFVRAQPHRARPRAAAAAAGLDRARPAAAAASPPALSAPAVPTGRLPGAASAAGCSRQRPAAGAAEEEAEARRPADRRSGRVLLDAEVPGARSAAGFFLGCAVATYMCCSCQFCCRDPFPGSWSGKPHEAWCNNCDGCDCCNCCDCSC